MHSFFWISSCTIHANSITNTYHYIPRVHRSIAQRLISIYIDNTAAWKRPGNRGVTARGGIRSTYAQFEGLKRVIHAMRASPRTCLSASLWSCNARIHYLFYVSARFFKSLLSTLFFEEERGYIDGFISPRAYSIPPWLSNLKAISIEKLLGILGGELR